MLSSVALFGPSSTRPHGFPVTAPPRSASCTIVSNHLVSLQSLPYSVRCTVTQEHPQPFYFHRYTSQFPPHPGCTPQKRIPGETYSFPCTTYYPLSTTHYITPLESALLEGPSITPLESTLPRPHESLSKQKTLTRLESALTRLRTWHTKQRTLSPVESALTRLLALSPLESALPEKRGEGHRRRAGE